MIEYINEKCNGCKLCVMVCPVDVLRMDKETDKAYIKYRDDCMCCFNCEVSCPVGAIYVSPERAKWVRLPW